MMNPLLYSEQQLHQVLANLDKIVFLRVPQTARVSGNSESQHFVESTHICTYVCLNKFLPETAYLWFSIVIHLDPSILFVSGWLCV